MRVQAGANQGMTTSGVTNEYNECFYLLVVIHNAGIVDKNTNITPAGKFGFNSAENYLLPAALLRIPEYSTSKRIDPRKLNHADRTRRSACVACSPRFIHSGN
jgi:hypothetical protein